MQAGWLAFGSLVLQGRNIREPNSGARAHA